MVSGYYDTSGMSSLPVRVFHREVGRVRKQAPFPRGAGGQVVSFFDVMQKSMSSLSYTIDQTVLVQPESIPTSPIPIYCLAKHGPTSTGLLIGDEAGDLHFIKNWFDPTPPNVKYLDYTPNSLHIAQNAGVTTIQCVQDKILVGTGSGHMGVLVLANDSDFVVLHKFQAHFKAVKKVDSFNGDVLVSCSKDNKICVYDIRMKVGNPVNIVHEVHNVPTTQSSSTSTGASPSGGRGRGRASIRATKEQDTTSSSVSDFVFLDEHRIISAGTSDGRLKEWDLRLSYKQFKKCHPVQILEYPSLTNVRGYSCLYLAGSKLYASSAHFDTFRFDIPRMECDMTFTSPTKLSNYTKIDVSHDGNFLACGSDESLVHIFSTRGRGQKLGAENLPFKSLNHSAIFSGPPVAVCCPVFSPFDDYSLTTGGDACIVTKWTPTIYLQSSRELEKEARKEELERESDLRRAPVKTEFQFLPTTPPPPPKNIDKENSTLKSPASSPVKSQPRERVCFAKLDSFPNYVVDGMRLPHVCPPKLRIKLKPRGGGDTALAKWTLTPIPKEVTTPLPQETTVTTSTSHLKLQPAKDKTPTRSSTTTNKSSASRKRKKFCDETLSPKIITFFSPVPKSQETSSSPTTPKVQCASETSPVTSRNKIQKTDENNDDRNNVEKASSSSE